MVRSRGEGSVWRRKKVGKDDDSDTGSHCKERIAGAVNARQEEDYYPLLSYHQLPEYMKDNEYILHYYRANWPLKQALFSLFSWHNETLNVWTHLLGFLLFVGLMVANAVDGPHAADLITVITGQFWTSVAESNNASSSGPTIQKLMKDDRTAHIRWPLLVFLCGAMFCLLSSSTCHLLSCHSRRLNARLLHIDYVGITVMIITSFFPPIYYLFQCRPTWQLLYLASITAIGACTAYALLSPALSSGKLRGLRALLFVSMGLFGVVPAAHALVLNWGDPHRNLTLAYEAAMAFSYLVGTGFYIGRVPERLRPGWFDLAGHSHQIFHVFVVAGALAHYAAARIFLVYRGGIGCGSLTVAV